MKTKRKRSFLRVICCLLVSMFILSDMPALQAKAASDMTVSDTVIKHIESYEGYSQYAMKDGAGYYIGYGTSCSPSDYPNGISMQAAEALLITRLNEIGTRVNDFLQKNSISLSQAQFDAIMSFTYNVGTNWMYSSTRLRTILVNGYENYSEFDILNAIGVWCHIGKKVSTNLISRRIEEATMFLHGHDNTNAEYVYLLFDAGSGDVEDDIVFYRKGEPYSVLQTSVNGSEKFSGWKTSEGAVITTNTIANSNLKVYASWNESIETSDSTYVPTGSIPTVSTALYYDVADTDWFYIYVEDLSEQKIISGYNDGSFCPNRKTTAGEALKLILLACGYSEQPSFGSHWADGYLAFALASGFVSPGEISSLDAPIDRVLVGKIVARAMSLAPSNAVSPFADISDGYITAVSEAGIINGSTDPVRGTLFKPYDSITRCEICAIIWRIYNSSNSTIILVPEKI